ncbi:CGNR zinc finger domain-containing protein [Streptomyces specialis]|uniref:CGNR zinc finger domain-containing protein n=1 Tax=Streptomyces specialis TaxID=498367 RepID=UPI00073E4C33|nr:ABATE domain-containing protein [Streptomyces specialis]
MSSAAPPPFRLDNEHLAFRFTATLSDRHGVPVERLPDPGRLRDWLRVNGLDLAGTAPTGNDLDLARRLREAIHRAGTAVAAGTRPAGADVELINRLAGRCGAFPVLEADGVRWRTRSRAPVSDALGVIARSAVETLGGAARERVKSCDDPACRGLYVDTSRGRNRRWCSMNTCGNREKKSRLRGRPAAP